MFRKVLKLIVALLLAATIIWLLTMAAGNYWAASFQTAHSEEYKFRALVLFGAAFLLIALPTALVIRSRRKRNQLR